MNPASARVTRSVDRAVVCPVLIGRDEYVEALDHLLGQVGPDRGQTLLISGEAGIGKSRLLASVRSRSEAIGFCVIQGNCFERDRTLPYAPVVDALRAFLGPRESAPALDVLSRFSPVPDPILSRLLPELGGPSESADDPRQTHERVIESLVGLLKQIASQQKLLLIVEDLHWSDSISLEVFGTLARRLRTQPVLLVGTYRDDHITSGVGVLLAELERTRLVTELRLNRLNHQQVGAMMRAISGTARPIDADLVRRVFELTDGNPFFVEEVLRSPDQLRLPHSVQDAVQRRTADLSPQARQIVVLAAVSGRRFEFALLQQLAGVDEPTLVQCVKDLINAQLVVEESEDRLAFRHALTREAICAQLLGRERRVMHRRIADVLEQQAGDECAEDLAYHFFESGDWPKAADYARRAGRRAQALYSPGAAVDHFSVAIDAISRQGLDVPGELYRQRALAHEMIGSFDKALADHEAALVAAQRSADQLMECRALLDLGCLWASRDYGRTGDHFRDALSKARELDQPAVLADALNRVGNWHANVEQPAEAATLHREALSIFQDLGDAAGMAQTLDLLALATAFLGDLSEALSLFERAIGMHRELHDQVALASSLSVRAVAGGGGSTWHVSPTTVEGARTALEAAEEALSISRQIGWRAGECFACHCLAEAAAGRGAYARAVEVASEGLDLAREIGHQEWSCALYVVMGTLLRDLGQYDDARRPAEAALAEARSIGSLYWTRVTAAALIELLVSIGELDRAELIGSEILERREKPTTIAARELRVAQAHAALARGDVQWATSTLQELRAGGSTPALDLRFADALLVAGQPAEAEQTVRHALPIAEASAYRSLHWRLQGLLSRTLVAQGRRREAEVARAAAETLARSIARDVPAALRNGFLQLAQRQIGSPTRRGSRDEAGLSQREREVAQLVAAGLSNRAIADRLVLGERTVESHVAAILARLQLSNRAQVAAWVAREDPGPYR